VEAHGDEGEEPAAHFPCRAEQQGDAGAGCQVRRIFPPFDRGWRGHRTGAEETLY